MLTSRTPLSEFHSRWDKTRQLCREHNLDAIVVWLRGDSAVDTAEDAPGASVR